MISDWPTDPTAFAAYLLNWQARNRPTLAAMYARWREALGGRDPLEAIADA